jgi:hypothetical protein
MMENIINGSKIYDANRIVYFYVGHLNSVYFLSGLGNVFLILLTTRGQWKPVAKLNNTVAPSDQLSMNE